MEKKKGEKMTIMSDKWIARSVKEKKIIEPFKSSQVRKGKYPMVYQVMVMMQE